MDAFADLEPIVAPNYNYSISFEEAAATVCEETGSGGVGGAEGVGMVDGVVIVVAVAGVDLE